VPGIYIHIPFCRQACSYCDFHFSVSLEKKAPSWQALLKEITLRKDYFLAPGKFFASTGITANFLRSISAAERLPFLPVKRSKTFLLKLKKITSSAMLPK